VAKKSSVKEKQKTLKKKRKKRLKKLFEALKKGSNEELCYNVARFARAQISPIASFLGGIIAQEVVKYTGKFTPI